MVTKEEVIQLYSNAAVFCCPSVYEPFGIINLEAMACETPVVATEVGGIKEIILQNETGLLVPLSTKKENGSEVIDRPRFAKGLAENINRVMKDGSLREKMAKKSRARVEREYSWESVARRVFELYKKVLEKD